MDRDEINLLLDGYLDGDLDAPDAKRLVEAVEADDDRSAQILDEVRWQGLISLALDPTDGKAFARGFFERVEAEGESAKFLKVFSEKRLSDQSRGSVSGPNQRSPSRLFTWVSVAAAILFLLITWALLREGYPTPRASGSFQVAGGGPLQRGGVLKTHERAAELDLGGYCSIKLAPQTKLRLEGEENDEIVMLEQGEIRCQVDRDIGAFAVRTEIGTVSVTGTEFTVRLVEGGTGMNGRRMLVRVLAGAVLVSVMGNTTPLSAGEEKGFSKEAEGDKAPVKAQKRNRKIAGVFKAYDKNKDDKVSFKEWCGMKEGVMDEKRTARERKWFDRADTSKDGILSYVEFAAWRTRGKAQPEGKKRGPRDGEGPARKGLRDGEGPAKKGPKDKGDPSREGAKDADPAGNGAPREGDR